MILVADGHTLFDDAFHATQANAQLGLDQLANGLGAAVAQVIDIVGRLGAVVDHDHAAHQAHNIPLGDHAVGDGNTFVQLELLVELVAADAFQVVMALIEELFFDKFAGVI